MEEEKVSVMCVLQSRKEMPLRSLRIFSFEVQFNRYHDTGIVMNAS